MFTARQLCREREAALLFIILSLTKTVTEQHMGILFPTLNTFHLHVVRGKLFFHNKKKNQQKQRNLSCLIFMSHS